MLLLSLLVAMAPEMAQVVVVALRHVPGSSFHRQMQQAFQM
jgi:hypothetical protein